MCLSKEVDLTFPLCKFCYNLETLKRHYFQNHKYCLDCDVAFKENGSLFEHLLTHHDQNVICVHCDYHNFDPKKLQHHTLNCTKKSNVRFRSVAEFAAEASMKREITIEEFNINQITAITGDQTEDQIIQARYFPEPLLDSPPPTVSKPVPSTSSIKQSPSKTKHVIEPIQQVTVIENCPEPQNAVRIESTVLPTIIQSATMPSIMPQENSHVEKNPDQEHFKEPPKVTPKDLPKSNAKAALKNSVKEAIKANLREVPKREIKESPKSSLREAPKREAPKSIKEPPKSSIRDTPKRIREPSPKNSVKEPLKSNLRDAPKSSLRDAPKREAPKREAPKRETPKREAPKSIKEPPKSSVRDTPKRTREPSPRNKESPKSNAKEPQRSSQRELSRTASKESPKPLPKLTLKIDANDSSKAVIKKTPQSGNSEKNDPENSPLKKPIKTSTFYGSDKSKSKEVAKNSVIKSSIVKKPTKKKTIVVKKRKKVTKVTVTKKSVVHKPLNSPLKSQPKGDLATKKQSENSDSKETLSEVEKNDFSSMEDDDSDDEIVILDEFGNPEVPQNTGKIQ